MLKLYKVVGKKDSGYAVVTHAGAIEYDLLGERKLAVAIKGILNAGIGPEWDLVLPELERRGISSETGI
jgi:hypothetical protein